MPWPIPTLKRYKQRFWTKVSKVPGQGIGDCWLWTGGTREGYGAFWMEGRTLGAHRVAWYFATGVWPLFACHTCDVKTCVRRSHLFDGTPLSNNQDAVRKKRHAWGIRNGSAKLTDELVLLIRYAYAMGSTQTELAKQYNISPRHVSLIVTGKVWNHLSLVKTTEVRRFSCGSQNKNAKLSEDQIATIRNSPLSQRKLGHLYSVSHTTIGSIKRGLAWWHV